MLSSSSFLKKLRPFSIGASMADMAMLLLVFFMATTTTEPPKGVEVDLPAARVKGAEQDSIYITVAKNGSIYYDGKIVHFDQLRDNLVLRQSEKDRVVSITADKELNYEKVAMVLSVLQEMDFLNVVFMAQERTEN